MTKMLLGVMAYVVFTFAYSWNMVLFSETYLSLASSSLSTAPMMQLGLVSVLLEGLALSVMFLMYYKGGDPLTEGLVLGLLGSSFSIGYASFVVPASFSIDPVWKYTVLESCFGLMHFGVAGIILGFIFNWSFLIIWIWSSAVAVRQDWIKAVFALKVANTHLIIWNTIIPLLMKDFVFHWDSSCEQL